MLIITREIFFINTLKMIVDITVNKYKKEKRKQHCADRGKYAQFNPLRKFNGDLSVLFERAYSYYICGRSYYCQVASETGAEQKRPPEDLA